MAQQQPHSLDMERYVLGSIMINKQKEVCKITEEDFYNNLHKRIYTIMNDLFTNNKNIDEITVADALSNHTVDAYEVTTRISDAARIGGRFDNALETLKTYTLRRSIIEKAYSLNSLAYEEIDGIMELKNTAMAIMDLKVADTQKKKSIIENVDDVMEDIDKQRNAKNDEAKKYFTNFYDLDKMMAGFHKEELTILAARPAVGKTAFGLHLMLELAHSDNYCYFISREMGAKALTTRLLSNLSEVNGNKFRLAKSLTQDDLKKLNQAKDVLKWLKINLDDRTSTIQAIRSKCMELKNDGKLDILIVDYLQLLNSSGKHSSRREEIEVISRGLKEIAMELSIPVLSLSQLSRSSASENREPALHDLRESGSIEQDADDVILLHQELNEDKTPKDQLKLIVAKQRNGPIGFIHLNRDKSTFKFTNIHRG